MIDYCKIPAGTRVLITGATGFTGQVLTRKLCDAGLAVSAIARKSSDISGLADLNIAWFRGDVSDQKVIQQAMEGQAYVFHLAAALRDAKSSKDDYHKVHVKSTQHMCREAVKNPDFKRYIHVSTIGVHGHIENPPANEASDFNPGDEYQRTKLEAEIWLADFAGKHTLNYTIIRPAAIYGPGDRRLLKLFKMATKPVFVLLGKGKCMYHLIHVEDLANAILTASTHEKALSEVFIIGAEEPIPIGRVAEIVARCFNQQLRLLRLPITPFFLAADLCEAICRPLKIEPPIYRRRVAFYSKDRHFDVSKMMQVLGFTPRYNNTEGLQETAKWYKNKGWL